MATALGCYLSPHDWVYLFFDGGFPHLFTLAWCEELTRLFSKADIEGHNYINVVFILS